MQAVRFFNTVLSAMALAVAAVNAQAASDSAVGNEAASSAGNKAKQTSMEQVVIVGSQADAKAMAGSAFVVDKAELEKFEYTDIHRILRQVPGVYIQQEDGYGLRPNIGIRGAGGARSEKITLMEDGVLIAPAPYSGPSAYYFPTTGRMSSVEVVKGPETIQYGPYTVGGALNLVSTPIPEQAEGSLLVELGEEGESRLHAWYGDSQDNYGWLIETNQQDADGFKSIDRSSRNAGLDKEDYLAKIRLNTTVGEGYYNQLDLKLQYSKETSNQSYLGLTDADFDADPNRRYGISSLDQMRNEHSAITLSHLIDFSDDLSLKTTLYYNEFERDWYKLSGGSSFINAANAGDAEAQAILDGSQDVEGLTIKHNAREYQSYGLQSTLSWKLNFANMIHDLDFGLRLHEDEVDRFQPQDTYNQVNGSLVYQGTSDPSSSNNRVEQAEALALTIMDHIEVNDRLDITAGLRYEDIQTDQYRYDDIDRSSGSESAANDTEVVLLALGGTYQLNDQWGLLAGVHEGFAPAGAGSENADPEESTNYEAGVRFSGEQLFAEVIYFYSDYANSVQYCTVANPCDEQVSGSISQGEAEIEGMELLINYDLIQDASYSVPLSFTYTYTDTEITQSSDDGSILQGDVLMDVPEQQWAASVGYVAASGWDSYLNASYISETCIDNSCDRAGNDNRFRETDDLLVFDLTASYPLNQQVRVYGKIDNLLDEQQIVSRKPDGARANKPRTVYVGMKVSF